MSDCFCTATVTPSSVPFHLGQFCQQVSKAREIVLCETQGDGYEVHIQTDDAIVAVCCFEKYMDSARLPGRKTDYLILVRHQDETYVVFVELRKTLTSDKQWENKLEQIKQSVEMLCASTESGKQHHRDLPEIFKLVERNHRVYGVVIPANRAKARYRQTIEFEIGGKTVDIMGVSPPSRSKRMLSIRDILAI